MDDDPHIVEHEKILNDLPVVRELSTEPAQCTRIPLHKQRDCSRLRLGRPPANHEPVLIRLTNLFFRKKSLFEDAGFFALEWIYVDPMRLNEMSARRLIVDSLTALMDAHALKEFLTVEIAVAARPRPEELPEKIVSASTFSRYITEAIRAIKANLEVPWTPERFGCFIHRPDLLEDRTNH